MKSESDFIAFRPNPSRPQTLPSIRNILNHVDDDPRTYCRIPQNTLEDQSNCELDHNACRPQNIGTAALVAGQTYVPQYHSCSTMVLPPSPSYLDYTSSTSSGSPILDSDAYTVSTGGIFTPLSRQSSTEILPPLIQNAHNKPKTRRNARRTDRQHGKPGRRDVSVISRTQHGNDAKNQNERDQRHAIQEGLQDQEDILQIYGGLGDICEREQDYGNVQTSGNATSSGLKFAKVNTLTNANVVLLNLLREKREHLSADEMRALIRHYVQVHREQPDEDKFREILLAGEGAGRCANSEMKGDKRCTTHGHPNWTDCRKERRRAAIRTYERRLRRATQGGIGTGSHSATTVLPKGEMF